MSGWLADAGGPGSPDAPSASSTPSVAARPVGPHLESLRARLSIRSSPVIDSHGDLRGSPISPVGELASDGAARRGRVAAAGRTPARISERARNAVWSGRGRRADLTRVERGDR